MNLAPTGGFMPSYSCPHDARCIDFYASYFDQPRQRLRFFLSSFSPVLLLRSPLRSGLRPCGHGASASM